MTPQEAIRRAERIVAKDLWFGGRHGYSVWVGDNTDQTFSTQEAREIMAGLLKALDEKALEAK